MPKKVKTTLKRQKNDALVAIHETATGLYETGVIDRNSMHKFDVACAQWRLRALSDSTLFKDFKDQKFAAEYLTACLEEVVGPFLRGLSNLFNARKIKTKFFGAKEKDQDMPFPVVLDLLKKLDLKIQFKVKGD
jgi:hypothetical protein